MPETTTAPVVRTLRYEVAGMPRYALDRGDGKLRWLDGPPWRGGQLSGQSVPFPVSASDATLLPPVAPSKIVCVGRNYRAHAAELGNEVPSEPLLFFKPPSSLLAHGGSVELPPPSLSKRVEHEVELALVVGKRLRKVDAKAAAAGIFGYTIAGDITARDLQRSDRLWTRGKGFDTFCPCGPHVVQGVNVEALDIRCDVNGETRQRGNTGQMVFRPQDVLAYISQVMTLMPGDLVLTGTPAGVGPLLAGDDVQMCVEGLGELRFRVTGFDETDRAVGAAALQEGDDSR